MKPESQRIAIAEWCGLDADYLNDLNAMHEAEKKFNVNQWHAYMNEFLPETLEDWRSAIHATASQRAEALLRTIGKWKDDSTPATINELLQKGSK